MGGDFEFAQDSSFPTLLVLSYQTWSTTSHSKTNLWTPTCDERKAFIARHQTWSPRQLVLRKPKLPNGFQGGTFKGKVRDIPGGPVVKALHFHFRGPKFSFWSKKLDPTCCN